MTAAALSIRLAGAEELPAVARLTHESYAHDYPIGPEYAHELLHPEDRLDDYEVWVAQHCDGPLLGTVSVLRPGRLRAGRVQEGELYFRLLAVSPTARRQGVGAALTRFTCSLATARGHHAVALNSGPQMHGAHALYRALGFERRRDRDVVVTEDGRELTILTFTRPVTSADRFGA